MPKHPIAMKQVLADLMTRRGYAAAESTARLTAAWVDSVGEQMAEFTRVNGLRRGMFEVTVVNSAIVQEFGFQKQTLLEALRRSMPDVKIRDLRFKVGPIQ